MGEQDLRQHGEDAYLQGGLVSEVGMLGVPRPIGRRAVIVTVGAVDVGLRIWALADLTQRPATSVRGPKAGWALALFLVNSAGALPLAYLIVGRRRS
jgi:hypothetical protein